ncbi:integrase [Pasteurellaceae bacterium Pebbles2]|nr:integrase [Pasteurellaceae bacterium Pebbles2]
MGEKKQNPRGVTIRKHKSSETINITFTFKGVRCREPLSLPVTQTNINYAARLLGEIQNKIERNTFHYADYFPTSSKLKIFGKIIEGVTVKYYLDDYLKNCISRKLSPSTINGYGKIITELSHFHNVTVSQLTPAMVKNWIKQQNCKAKTVRNKLSVLRSALDEAITDGVIQFNPVSLVTIARYIEKKDTSSQNEYLIDPFAPNEVALILEHCQHIQHRNLFQFAFHTGLRSSELCALKWVDIDFEERTAYIQHAKVIGIMKGTKTKSGTRLVELDDMALSVLQEQKELSEQSDFIFLNPKGRKPWNDASQIRKSAWIPAIKESGVRYRNPYQTRHTFATMHISIGCNLFWLAQQMGHKGLEMIYRNYGAYLKEYENQTKKSRI